MQNKKLLLTLVIFCASGCGVRGAEIQWTATNGTVPADGNTYYIDTEVTLDGTLTIARPAILEVRSGGSLISNGASITHSGTLTVKTGGTVTTSGTFYNAYTNWYGATINVDGGTFTKTGPFIFTYGHHTNAVLNISNGGTFTNSGSYLSISNADGRVGTININTGGTFNTSANFYNSGTVNLNGGTMNSGQVDGTINVNSGTWNHTYGTMSATLDISGGSVSVQNSTFAPSTTTISGGSLFINDNGTFANSSTFAMSGGEFRTIGAFRNSGNPSSTGTVNVTGGTMKLESGTVTNAYGASSNGSFTVGTNANFQFGNVNFLAGGGASSSIDIFGQTYSGNAISSGTMVVDGTMTIPSGSLFTILSGGTLQNNGTIVANGLLLTEEGGTYEGDQPAGGTTYDPAAALNIVPVGRTLNIPNGYTLTINSDQRLAVGGVLSNQSDTSVDVYGTVYTYSTFENGTPSLAGTLNIHYGGEMYLLSGNLINRHASSAINILPGGKLINYLGTIDFTNGTLTLNNGATLDNVRGGYPVGISPANGANFFDGDVMNLIQDIELDYTWTITEKAKLFGNGNKITFSTDGGILIEGADASLLLEDVLIENVSGNQIRCTENSTTLSLDNVTWVQDANYSFTKGILNINGDWRVIGKNTTFAYSSDQASTLQQDTNWIFDTNVTFSYDSSSSGNIVLTDATAKIHFDGATLHVAKDARFKDGTFSFDKITTLNTEVGRTLYFGNNNASENLTLDFHNLSKTIIAGSGTLTNQNV